MVNSVTATPETTVFFCDVFRCIGPAMRLNKSQKNSRCTDHLITSINHEMSAGKHVNE